MTQSFDPRPDDILGRIAEESAIDLLGVFSVETAQRHVVESSHGLSASADPTVRVGAAPRVGPVHRSDHHRLRRRLPGLSGQALPRLASRGRLPITSSCTA